MHILELRPWRTADLITCTLLWRTAEVTTHPQVPRITGEGQITISPSGEIVAYVPYINDRNVSCRTYTDITKAKRWVTNRLIAWSKNATRYV